MKMKFQKKKFEALIYLSSFLYIIDFLILNETIVIKCVYTFSLKSTLTFILITYAIEFIWLACF